MPREFNVISHAGSGSGGDACTYMWACAICDENETLPERQGRPQPLAGRQTHGADRIQSPHDEQ